MSKRSSGAIVAAVALACIVGSSTRSEAALIAYICDDVLCAGGNDTIVTDNGPGDNFPGSSLLGQINSGALSFNGFTIITNVTQSKPLIGSATAPQLDLTFNAVTNDDLDHTVFLYASDTGFTGSGNFSLTMGGTQPLPGDGNSIRGRAWGGTSNNNLDISGANLLADTGTTTATPFALTSNGVFGGNVSPYSLTIGVTLFRTTPGATTGDLNFISTGTGGGSGAGQTVPEPATLVLFGGALALAANRRRKTRA
jgi:hypothetical protein